MLLSCDVGTNLKVEKITELDRLHNKWNHKTYLVESSEGDLLRVIRVIEDEYHYEMTIKFVVYKLVDFCGDSHWAEVNSLGNDALFLGDNHSISVVAFLILLDVSLILYIFVMIVMTFIIMEALTILMSSICKMDVLGDIIPLLIPKD